MGKRSRWIEDYTNTSIGFALGEQKVFEGVLKTHQCFLQGDVPQPPH